MPKITREDVRVPADVMPEMREEYIDNYMAATRGTGRLMLFACDQKIEHLNKDFYGEGIDISDGDPEHLFQIGSQGTIGVLAGQRGLIAQYANDYPEINYLVKMNSKTNLVKTAQKDPYSPQLYDIEAVLAALRIPPMKGKPTLILCHTHKGKGVSFMEDQVGWHGKAPNEQQRAEALKELEG